MERKNPRLSEVVGGDKKIEPFAPRREHNPGELRSWAKRTGFVSKNFSGETSASENKTQTQTQEGPVAALDLDKGFRGLRRGSGGSSPKIEIDPVLGRTRPARPGGGAGGPEVENSGGHGNGNGNGNGKREEVVAEQKKEKEKDEVEMGVNQNGTVNRNVEDEEEQEVRENVVHGDGSWRRHSRIKCGLRDNPGFVPLICYGLQHYLSLAGSLIFIPIIMVPAMGGTDRDTATVISTMLLVSGITTLLHSCFGTRLPLVQGSSFAYLAPALVIMNSRELRNLTEHKFRHIMREVQGAILVGSIFQSLLGFSGLMNLLLRLINPIVVAPTVAAVGLAFFSYGFPQAGSCVEISLPLILLVLIFTLYLRGISIFGHRVFRVYAVPFSVIIVWTYAFFLTAGGAYNYKGCSNDNVPSSNILNDVCRKHAYTMQHCRTDASNAWRTASWVRIPYPLQWGIPIFHLRTSLIMVVASLVASVDSIGTYHTTAVLINVKAPTPGIVSRGIALEGFCSILAGLLGSGTGSTTLTENLYTIEVTNVASRRALQFGAGFLILFSFIGKVGAILASIPLALAAATLCFIWALTVALGLSTLQYSQTASFRNITIVGVSLFLGLSIPAYFQQYQPESTLILPSYFIPYAAASDGPVHSGNKQIDFAINALLSLNMVVTLLIALVLDNTAPGSRQERGVYVWSKTEEIRSDPSSLADYSLPGKFCSCLCLPKCLGV